MTLQPRIRRRIVIDNNVIIPTLTYEHPGTHWLVQLWQSRQVTPLISDETITELRAKILERSPTPKPLQAQRFVTRSLRYYIPWCDRVALQVNVNAPQCRDPRDQMFIDLAIAGEAEYLITRDGDLLSMRSVTSFSILDDTEFRAIASFVN